MTKRSVVIRKTHRWQPNIKRKIQLQASNRPRFSGFISPVFVVLACTAFSGLLYIYSINQTAVKGIEMRRVEQEIANQKKTNEALKIKEAELKSLYRIEQQSKELNMVDCPDVKYIEENSSVAYGTE